MNNGRGWLRQILTLTLPPISQSRLSESISPISASSLQQQQQQQQPLPLNTTTATLLITLLTSSITTPLVTWAQRVF
jgi:hypothetical protein